MLTQKVANCAYPALGIGFGVRCPKWCVDNMEVGRLEHIIKGVCKLAVSIVNQVVKYCIVLLKVPDELPGLLGDPG